jgi:hypothetical protein
VLACAIMMQMAERWQLAARCWLAVVALRCAMHPGIPGFRQNGLGDCAVLLIAVVLLGWAGC